MRSQIVRSFAAAVAAAILLVGLPVSPAQAWQPPSSAPAAKDQAPPTGSPPAPASQGDAVTITLKTGDVIRGNLVSPPDLAKAKEADKVVITSATLGRQEFPKAAIDHIDMAILPADPLVRAQATVSNVETFFRTLIATIASYLPQAVGALIVLVVAVLLAGRVRAFVRRALDRTKLDPTLVRFIPNVAWYIVLVFGVLTCAPILGISITAFAAVLGTAGLAIGLASQGALSNAAAGLMLLLTHPFRVGDVIVVDGVSGIVDEIQLLTTRLNTPDNRRIYMPNSTIFGKVIENSTHNPTRSTTFQIVTSADVDIEQVRSVIIRALDGCSLVLKDPAPAALISNIENSAIRWDVTAWAETRKLGPTRDQAIAAVRDAIASVGVKLPMPAPMNKLVTA